MPLSSDRSPSRRAFTACLLSCVALTMVLPALILQFCGCDKTSCPHHRTRQESSMPCHGMDGSGDTGALSAPCGHRDALASFGLAGPGELPRAPELAVFLSRDDLQLTEPEWLRALGRAPEPPPPRALPLV